MKVTGVFDVINAGTSDVAVHQLSMPATIEQLEARICLSAIYVSTSAALQAAANAVRPGDVVHIAKGSYTGFTVTRDGTAAKRIVFQGDEGAVINRSGKYGDGINLEGADYVTIDNIDVLNTSGTITRAGIRAVTDTGVIIRNCVVDGAGKWCIFTAFSENVLIEDNVASHAKEQHSIYVSNSADHPTIRGNEMFGSRQCGLQLNGDKSEGGDGIISGALIELNNIHDNGSGGGAAINLDGVQGATIRNNVLTNNHASGIAIFRQDGGGNSTGNTVTGNTIKQATGARAALNFAAAGNTSDYNTLSKLNKYSLSGKTLTFSAWQKAGYDLHSTSV